VSTVSDRPTHRAPTNRPAEMISVSQLAMINNDFAQYRDEIWSIPTSFIADMVRRAQADGYCEDDGPQLIALANIFYQAIYYEEGS
jgi:hypothetical protein